MNCSKLLLAAAVLLFSNFAKSQNTSGEAFFTETIKLQIDLDENAPEEMKKMLPPEQKVHKSLIFNEKASLYKNAGAANEGDVELKHEEDGNDMNIVIKMPEITHFTDLENDKWVRAEEFFGRNFLILGDWKPLQWKLTGEQKQLGDWVCQKAVLQDTAQNVVAWFTPQIPVAAGPGQFGQLPGLILELDFDNGQRVSKISKINLRPVAADELAKPTKGKEVSAEEFQKIRDEKMKEMGMETGGKPGTMKMIIKTQDTRD